MALINTSLSSYLLPKLNLTNYSLVVIVQPTIFLSLTMMLVASSNIKASPS